MPSRRSLFLVTAFAIETLAACGSVADAPPSDEGATSSSGAAQNDAPGPSASSGSGGPATPQGSSSSSSTSSSSTSSSSSSSSSGAIDLSPRGGALTRVPIGRALVKDLNTREDFPRAERGFAIGGHLYFVYGGKRFTRSNGTSFEELFTRDKPMSLLGVRGSHAYVIEFEDEVLQATGQLLDYDAATTSLTAVGTANVAAFAASDNLALVITKDPFGNPSALHRIDATGLSLVPTVTTRLSFVGSTDGGVVFADGGSAYAVGASGAPTLLHAFAEVGYGPFAALGGKVAFFARESEDAPFRPWVSDGTAAGTILLSATIQRPDSWGSIYASHGRAFFSDRVNQYTTDGTPAGTLTLPWLVTQDVKSVASDGATWFVNIDGAVYQTDGTASGGHSFRGGNYGPLFGAPYGRLVAGLESAFGDDQLYTATGTPSDGTLLKDIFPGPDGASAVGIGQVGGLVLFNADDPDGDNRLYRTDGTSEGTKLVPVPIAERPTASIQITNVAALPGKTLMFGRLPVGHSSKFDDGGVWAYDGNDLVKLSTATTGTLNPVVVCGGRAYFDDYGISPQSLWVSDGTAAGTKNLGGGGEIHTDGVHVYRIVRSGATAATFSMVTGSGMVLLPMPTPVAGKDDWTTVDARGFVASECAQGGVCVVTGTTVKKAMPAGTLLLTNEPGPSVFATNGGDLFEIVATGAATPLVEAPETLIAAWQTTHAVFALGQSKRMYGWVRGTPSMIDLGREMFFHRYTLSRSQAVALGNTLVFACDHSVCASDGTASGTKTLGAASRFSSAEGLVAFGNRVYFANTALGGLASTDGDSMRLEYASTSSDFYGPVGSIAAVANGLILADKDGTHGAELFSYGITP